MRAMGSESDKGLRIGNREEIVTFNWGSCSLVFNHPSLVSLDCID